MLCQKACLLRKQRPVCCVMSSIHHVWRKTSIRPRHPSPTLLLLHPQHPRSHVKPRLWALSVETRTNPPQTHNICREMVVYDWSSSLGGLEWRPAAACRVSSAAHGRESFRGPDVIPQTCYLWPSPRLHPGPTSVGTSKVDGISELLRLQTNSII